MPNILQSAYGGEGPTDERFLGPIIDRTLEELLLEAKGQIEVFAPVWLQSVKGKQDVVQIVKDAQNAGFHIVCLHADADRRSYNQALSESFGPAFAELSADSSITIQIVPIIPERTIESWMLADQIVFRNELLTDKSMNDLGLSGNPEKFANPKAKIQEAIRIANLNRGAHLHVPIHDLYELIGENIELSVLANLTSYSRFRENMRKALVNLNFLEAL